MRARAPASSANLGPGFDALAVALDLHVEVRVEPSDRLTVATTGQGAELPADGTHLAARLAIEILGTDALAVTVHSDIPVGRGLGSSAALAVATAAAAGAEDPLHWGMVVDGHPENAAASTLGGLVAAAVVDGRATAARLPLDPDLRFVLVIPDRVLPTAQARAALPATVPHADAAFNLGRLGLLVAGLADHRQLFAGATADRLHQEARTRLHPSAPALLESLLAGGALASCWSGAGPTLLGLAPSAVADDAAAAARRAAAAAGVTADVVVLAADTTGVVVDT